MTDEVTLDEFEAETSSRKSHSLALDERLLTPISPFVGLRLLPGRGDPLYLQNRGTERYLFRDEHDRWFILQPSAKDSEEAYVRWGISPGGQARTAGTVGTSSTDSDRLRLRSAVGCTRPGQIDGDRDVRHRTLARDNLRVRVV